jgi:restriction system protein
LAAVGFRSAVMPYITTKQGEAVSNIIPTFDDLMNPLLRALKALGGSGSIDEIYEKVLELEDIPEDISSIPHNPDKSNQTEVAYRLAWARTYLKKYGYLENSSRGVWALTQLAKEQEIVNQQEVVKTVRAIDKKKPSNKKKKDQVELENDDTPEEAQEWKEELYHILTKDIEPDAFERLTQRLLRESGFVQVEVTGRTGDGGIDGKGIAKIHGFMSFHVIFQCKRYQGTVSAGAIRDFRGAMVGRADKGLFITTGTFTSSAIKEATRDGAPPIDLVDGEQLADKLKELKLGVHTEMVEKVTINKDWFINI